MMPYMDLCTPYARQLKGDQYGEQYTAIARAFERARSAAAARPEAAWRGSTSA